MRLSRLRFSIGQIAKRLSVTLSGLDFKSVTAKSPGRHGFWGGLVTVTFFENSGAIGCVEGPGMRFYVKNAIHS